MKEIYVESCENCPNVRKMAISVYCVLNGARNHLALDYKIPDWCPLQDYKMVKIEVNDENIDIIARAEFKKQTGKELEETTVWIRHNWIDGAIKMLDNYNKVVEILTENKVRCKYDEKM